MSEFGELCKVDAVNMVMGLCRYYVDLNKKFWDDHSSDSILRGFDEMESEFLVSIPEVIGKWLKDQAWFVSELEEGYGAYKSKFDLWMNSSEMRAESEFGGESECRSVEDGELSLQRIEDGELSLQRIEGGGNMKYLCADWTEIGGYKCERRGELGCFHRNSMYYFD